MPLDTPTDEELALATDWHGGQASMLYAVASAGTLSRGDRRPVVTARRMVFDKQTDYETITRDASDQEWDLQLLSSLRAEVESIAEEPSASPADRRVAVSWALRLSREIYSLAMNAQKGTK